MNTKRIPVITLALLILLSLPARSAVSDEDFAMLKADLMALLQRVSSLESENHELRATTKQVVEVVAKRSNSSSASAWADDIKWKGDFRYRYEGIRIEDQDNQDRNRIRGRIALIASLPQDVEVGFGLATGGDDPVSTNQTLGGGGSTKEVRLNLAYFNWAATDSLNVVAGKFKNIWFRPDKNELIWDSDYNPEGFAMTYKGDKFFVNSGLNWLESDTKKGNTRFAWGIQSGFTTNIGDNILTTGVSYYDLPVQGREVFFGEDGDFFGNSFTCVDPVDLVDCTYDNNYEEVEIFAEIKTHLGDMPVTLFGDYVQNTAVDEFDAAWAAGIKVGKASNSGTWEVAYRYQDLEADSLFGLTVNSDFAGGGTDSKGHIFQGTYALNKKWKLALTYFVNKRNGNQGIEEDYDRIQIDTKFKF